LRSAAKCGCAPTDFKVRPPLPISDCTTIAETSIRVEGPGRCIPHGPFDAHVGTIVEELDNKTAGARLGRSMLPARASSALTAFHNNRGDTS
jgi:hypothetical protein